MESKPNSQINYPSHFSREELLECAHGRLFGPGNARLPLPPMLMMDRVLEITKSGGKYDRGFIVAEFDLNPDLWFFKCHFENDPVMPGCLGVDALWQLVGFYLGWLGHPGIGRALGSGEIKFSNQALVSNKKVTYRIDIKRVLARGLILGIADGAMLIDDQPAYECNDLRVGLFNQEEMLKGKKA